MRRFFRWQRTQAVWTAWMRALPAPSSLKAAGGGATSPPPPAASTVAIIAPMDEAPPTPLASAKRKAAASPARPSPEGPAAEPDKEDDPTPARSGQGLHQPRHLFRGGAVPAVEFSVEDVTAAIRAARKR